MTGGIAVRILNAGTRSGWVVSYRYRVLCLLKRHPPSPINLTGGRVDSRFGLEALGKTTISAPAGIRAPFFVIQHVASKTEKCMQWWGVKGSGEKVKYLRQNAAYLIDNIPKMLSWIMNDKCNTHMWSEVYIYYKTEIKIVMNISEGWKTVDCHKYCSSVNEMWTVLNSDSLMIYTEDGTGQRT